MMKNKKFTETDINDIYSKGINNIIMPKITDKDEQEKNKESIVPSVIEDRIKKDFVIFVVLIGFVISVLLSSVHNVLSIIPFAILSVFFVRREISLYHCAVRKEYCICCGIVQKVEFDGVKLGKVINISHYNVTVQSVEGYMLKFRTKSNKKYSENSPVTIYVLNNACIEKRGITAIIDEKDFLAVSESLPDGYFMEQNGEIGFSQE